MRDGRGGTVKHAAVGWGRGALASVFRLLGTLLGWAAWLSFAAMVVQRGVAGGLVLGTVIFLLGALLAGAVATAVGGAGRPNAVAVGLVDAGLTLAVWACGWVLLLGALKTLAQPQHSVWLTAALLTCATALNILGAAHRVATPALLRGNTPVHGFPVALLHLVSLLGMATLLAQSGLGLLRWVSLLLAAVAAGLGWAAASMALLAVALGTWVAGARVQQRCVRGLAVMLHRQARATAPLG